MQFILEQQAASAAWQQQFEVDMKAMQDRQVAFEAALQLSHAAFQARQENFQVNQEIFEARQSVFETNQTAIQKTQIQQLEMINRLIDLSAEQRASGKATDERLNALIRVVDGIIRKN